MHLHFFSREPTIVTDKHIRHCQLRNCESASVAITPVIRLRNASVSHSYQDLCPTPVIPVHLQKGQEATLTLIMKDCVSHAVTFVPVMIHFE